MEKYYKIVLTEDRDDFLDEIGDLAYGDEKESALPPQFIVDDTWIA